MNAEARKYLDSEKGQATRKRYVETHHTERLEVGRRYRERNREKLRERKRVARRVWRAANPISARAKYLKDAKRWREANPIRTLLYDARQRAKANGIPFDIDERDVALPSHCPVLGIPLIPRGKPFAPTNVTLDRLNPRKGYIKGNVAVISWRANKLKCDVVDSNELRRVADWMDRMLAK